ncbi:MAG: hypothetical protein MK195_09195, partial [Acidimicrobiales bacterium]|nr:hypothetical protein [Acidimicrobiales bacterium]
TLRNSRYATPTQSIGSHSKWAEGCRTNFAEIVFDSSKPDGMPRKVLDVSKLTELGWKARVPLSEGLTSTYKWFCDAKARGEIRE